MKKTQLFLLLYFSITTFGQVGINTTNPQGIFNVDGGKNNSVTGIPSSTQQQDDFVVTRSGQIGIGKTEPDIYSMLDVSADNKGILIPRVNLLSTTYDLNSDADNNISNQPQGLLVYNNGNILSKGYYFWNGSEWMVFKSSTGASASLGNLVCNSATISPAGYTSGIPYSGNIRVAYKGGNGGSYQPGSSVTVHGLTFTLRAGELQYGDGELVFSVTGTPDTNLDFTVNLTETEIPFLTSSQSCTATITNQTSADVKTVAYSGYLTQTSDNGRLGYHLLCTTPDGKWSVRAFVPNGSTFEATNLQLRYNGSQSDPATKDIISNATYMWGGGNTTSGNQYRHPKNEWAGSNSDTNALTLADRQTSSNFPAWGDPGVYAAGRPEYRLYHWSEFDPSIKIFYTMEFMMAAGFASGVNGTANVSNCPGGICSGTKVFFYLRQITAP